LHDIVAKSHKRQIISPEMYIQIIYRRRSMKMKLKTRLHYILIALFAMATLSALQIDGQTKKKKITYYAINAGTVLRVRLHHELSSKTAHIGMAFTSTTVDPVYSSGGVQVIPAGSVVHGKVTHVKPAAKNGEPGTIDVDFVSVTMPNKRSVAINGTLVSLDENGAKSDNEGTVSANKTSNRHLKFIGGGAAGGAIIGGIAGGGTGALIGAGVGAVGGLLGKNLSKGKDAVVKAGTEFGVYLNRKISLPRY
jgi:hypothetical protein